MRLRIKQNKKLVFENPTYKVPPYSKEWFEDTDLARLQKMIYKKEKRRVIKKAIVSTAAEMDDKINN